jgi:hypothetical protein
MSISKIVAREGTVILVFANEDKATKFMDEMKTVGCNAYLVCYGGFLNAVEIVKHTA